MADLLLELFSEEIPARMQREAQSHIVSTLKFTVEKAGYELQHSDWSGFSTPRRIAIIAKNLPAVQPGGKNELKGPRVDAPEQAIQGFLKKCGKRLEELEQRDGIYVAKTEQGGKSTPDILKIIIEAVLNNFSWPKSMRWGNGNDIWVRPLHSILCIFDGKIVPVEFAGIKAGNVTYGHRFLSLKPITIKNAGEYEKALRDTKVIASWDNRKEMIREKIREIAAVKGFSIMGDELLLEEVTGLIEWPVVLMGGIDKEFMDLPPEVLSTVMKKHQKYFSLNDKGGKLAPHFLVVSNMEAGDGGKAIVAGNERVLRARFADARFFWDQDRKQKLDTWAKGLESVTFHAKLGTIADKVERIRKLSGHFSDYAKADKKSVERAATLCKADLVTGMVGEFAELQGVMGRYYALAQGEKPEVADAIRDHYKPQGPADSVPSSSVSICVALADKLDTLVSMFAIGEKPTGSKDPFALRRAALGVIRIILENNLRLPLKTFLNEDLLAFFHDRLIVQLKDSGIRHDVIKAVVANGDDDLMRIVNRARAVQDFLETDDGKNLLAGYKRAANIVSIEEKKDKATYQAADLKAELLKEKEEKELAALLDKTAAGIKSALDKENFAEAMKLLSTLRAPVDLFFDKVMVNCEDRDLRAARLRLLSRIRGGMDAIADFGAIEGEAKEQKKAA